MYVGLSHGVSQETYVRFLLCRFIYGLKARCLVVDVVGVELRSREGQPIVEPARLEDYLRLGYVELLRLREELVEITLVIVDGEGQHLVLGILIRIKELLRHLHIH